MKKITLFIAALMLSFTAQAAVVNCTPNTNAIEWWLTQGDTLVLADGEYLEDYSITFDKPGVCVKAAEGAKPVIKLTGEWTVFDVQATTTFEGITFDGGNVANYLIATTGVNSGTLTVNNCEFRNWKYWALSNQFEETASIDSVIVNNTIFHDGAEAAISFNKKAPEGLHSCNYFSLTNSTIYNVKSTQYAGIVHVSSNGEATGMQNTVIIDHVTMYNLDGADLGIIAVRKSSDLTISNTIIANSAEGERASYVYGGVAENVIYYNVEQDGDLTYTNCLNVDPLFVDAANGDFNLQPGSPAIGKATDGSNLGDPRWKVAAAELSLTLTAPAADVEATDLYTIGWTVLDPDGDATIKLEYKAEEGEWTTIVEGLASNVSSYDWNIRKMAAQTVSIRGTLANEEKSIVSEAVGKLTIVPEAVAPRPVRELEGTAEGTSLTLNWINPDQAYEVSSTLETLENAETFISNDGTAELTLSEDKTEVTVAYTTPEAWHMAGIRVPVSQDYVNSIDCELKRDAADGTQIQITIEQNDFDWWYLIVTDITTDWSEYSFTNFEKLGWHNNSEADVLDGTNVTAIYVATNDGNPLDGSISLRNLTLNGAVPAVEDFEKTIICVSETAYPSIIVAEEIVYEGAESTCTIEIDPKKDLYVSAFAQDDLGNTSVAAQYMYVGKGEATGLENIQSSERAIKVIRNGQIIIVRGNETFNVLGQEVK